MAFPFRLYVNWRFMRGIEAQFLALQKGFNELIPQHLLKPFDQKELEVSARCPRDLRE
jgi:E3 ubiquitin ligase SMURF1/2